MFINGHFCYTLKFAVITNALGLHLAIQPLFDIKPSNSDPIEDKAISDSKALLPCIEKLFTYIPNNFSTFIADSILDSANIYSTLKNSFNFSKIVIPLNKRAHKNSTPTYDPNIIISEDGTPICQKFYLPFKPEGKCQGKNRSMRFNGSALCLHTKTENISTRALNLVLLLSQAEYFYTYPDNLRSFPGINKNSQEFLNLYKKRVVIEQTIAHLKSYMGSDILPTRDHISLLSDFLVSAVSFLLLFILSHAIPLRYSKLTIKKLNKLKKLIA